MTTMAPKKIWAAISMVIFAESTVTVHTFDGPARTLLFFNMMNTVSKKRLVYIPNSTISKRNQIEQWTLAP